MDTERPRRPAVRTPPFHGGNTGSNPVGDANKTKDLKVLSSKNVGLKRFDKDFRVLKVLLMPLPALGNIPNLAYDPIMSGPLDRRDSLRVHVHGDLEVCVTERFLDRFTSSPLAFIRVPRLCRSVCQPTGSVIFNSSLRTGLR